MRLAAYLLLLAGTAAACRGTATPTNDPDLASPQPGPTEGVVRAETFASGLEFPWAIAFLPDGRLLVTERPGRLRLVARDGTVSPPLGRVPTVAAVGQGGLLDVAVDPRFASNGYIYVTYAEPQGSLSGTAMARLTMEGDSVVGAMALYRQRPKVRGNGHFGSRIVFADDSTLFVTQGDRQSYRERAQDLTQGMGKIVRLRSDGRIPADNPFVGRSDAQPEIWSYGHRNLQAATLHPTTGQLWTVEHGARGGDELNHPEAGKNYGWPVITYGRDYSGASIGEGVAKEGMEQPVYYWDPVIAPSGMTFYTAEAIPGWKGSLLVGSLSPGALVRLELRDGRVVREERHLMDLRERIRDVQQGPDGLIYLVTDSPNGRILRVSPVAPASR